MYSKPAQATSGSHANLHYSNILIGPHITIELLTILAILDRSPVIKGLMEISFYVII